MDSKFLEIKGSNSSDGLKRLTALEILNNQETTVLVRLSELAEMPKAVSHIKNDMKFFGLKVLINKI